MLDDLYLGADELNQIYLNQTEMAKDYGVSKVKINQFIRRLTDIAFLYKIARGVYMVNPFVVVSSKVKNNTGGDMSITLQNKWKFLVGIPPRTNGLEGADTLIDKIFNVETRHFESEPPIKESK
jgi:hypothetical protein